MKVRSRLTAVVAGVLLTLLPAGGQVVRQLEPGLTTKS